MGPGINLVVSCQDWYISEIAGLTENFHQQYTRVQKKIKEIHMHLFMYRCTSMCICIYTYIQVYTGI